MTKITVEAVTKQARTYNDETFYSIKSGPKWIAIHGLNRKPVKGEVLTVDEIRETPSDSGRSFYDATVVQQQPVAETKSIAASLGSGPETIFVPIELKAGSRVTPYTQPLSQWERVVDAAMAVAFKHSIIDDAARVSLVACLTIPFGEGKLVVDSDWIPPEIISALSQSPTSEPPDSYQRQKELDKGPQSGALLPGQSPLFERHMAHTELEAACLQYGGMCVPTKLPASILFGVAGTRNVLELSEKEAIEAKHKVEKLIEDNADWKTKLLMSIKECCKAKGLDYDIQKWEILYNCTGTRSYQGLDQLAAKKGLLVLKEKYNWPEAF